MQLTFPNGEHADVQLEQGQITLGSARDNRVALAGAGLSSRHATFTADRRGLWLALSAGAPPAHINGRPVRQLALLRPGDVVSLERAQVLLRADETPAIERRIPDAAPAAPCESARIAAARVVLRGVAGAHFGRSFALTAPLLVGRSANADLRIDDPAFAERHAQIELHGERVILRALGAEATQLNGVPVRDAVLAPGDQLVFDQHRFVLEAPGLPPRGEVKARQRSGGDTLEPAAPTTPVANPVLAMHDRSQTVWWLIAAAAVIAALLTVLLVYAPRLGG